MKTYGFLLVLALLLMCVHVTLTSNGSCPVNECDVKIKPIRHYSQFDRDGIPLNTVAAILNIDTNTTECVVNTSALIESLNLPETEVISIYAFTCQKPAVVRFTKYNGRKYDNIMAYIQITRCNISVDDFDAFAKSMDSRVTNFVFNYFTDPCGIRQTFCPGFASTAALLVDNNDIIAPNVTDLLSCVPDFPDMAEVTFKNVSWHELPSVIREKFANLQALEIPNNYFTLPPNFPWTDAVLNLPRNLSRRPFFQNHYSEAFNLAIPANIFRRIFNLDENKINDLSNFEFHGFLHMITLRNNNLTVLGNTTFSDVTGLQTLDLSFNSLTDLPVSVFKGMTSLRRLDLKKNSISKLTVGMFDDLVDLQHLDLSNNSLTELGIGLFSRLSQLHELHLEFNNITTLHTDTFPVDSTKFEKIFLHHNPILILPEFIFWIRQLKAADLHATLINFNNLTGWLEDLDFHRLAESVVETASGSNIDIKRKNPNMRFIDLSYSMIDNICLENMTKAARFKLTLIINNFRFKLQGNPLNCNCKILPLLGFIDDLIMNNTIEGNEYYFTGWRCFSPVELMGRLLMGVKPQETYCKHSYINCPKQCTCNERSIRKSVIVDCRMRGLLEIHQALPDGELELWYQINNITSIPYKPYLNRVISLNVAGNKISLIDPQALAQFTSMQTLHLASNLLAELPQAIQSRQFKEITLRNNPFRCDCRTLWMKNWIQHNADIITDLHEISCNDESEQGREFVKVPDDEFTCAEEFDSIRHVVLPSVVCSIIFILCLVVCIILYAYRLECKVLMYVYLGVHPFDNDNPNDEENVDAVIVHSGSLTDWVMNHIVDILEGRDFNFVVCDMDRDFVIGFSFQENLSRVVRHSRRMILCVSEDWEPQHEKFKVAWNIAQEKIKESKSHYGIIISHGISKKQIHDKDLQRYIRRGRYIDSSQKLFVEKVLYSMPIKGTSRNIRRRLSTHVTRQFIASAYRINEEEEASNANCHAFLSYSDYDTEFVMKELQPGLEENGYKLCIPDRDFIPGASKEENILKAMDIAMRTIFILSENYVQDEWSLFTFRTASEKSLREKSNHLIVIVRENFNSEKLDEEIKHYLNSYICLNTNDRWFWQKLQNGLPPLRKDGESTHTSPLFKANQANGGTKGNENVAFENEVDVNDIDTKM